jgi:DNA mismatch endonuclease, patch repair protein
MDRVSPQVRSKIMASIRTFGGVTERKMEALLRTHGLRGFRKQWPVPGKPDFVWLKPKVALFVDGCFWHGCLRCNRPSKSNRAFWRSKIVSNRRRDARVARKLRKDGWKVLRVWECTINEKRTVFRIKRAIHSLEAQVSTPPPPAASSPTTASTHTAKSRHWRNKALPAAYRYAPAR